MRKFAAVTVILGALRLTEGQPCPPGTYRDKVTGRCDPCSDICEHKDITGSLDECFAQCPDYGQTVSTESSSSVPSSTVRFPACEEGHAYIKSLDRCDTCYNVCLSLQDGRRTHDCEIHCPEEYKKTSSMSKDQIIVTSATVLCSIFIIIAAVGLLMLYCRKRTRRRHPTVPEAPVTPQTQHPHPTVTYVPVSVHVQCEDSQTCNGSLVAEDDRLPTEEEEKFPRAYPDLPSSARPVHG